jgi:hypothetical protein
MFCIEIGGGRNETPKKTAICRKFHGKSVEIDFYFSMESPSPVEKRRKMDGNFMENACLVTRTENDGKNLVTRHAICRLFAVRCNEKCPQDPQ